MAQVKCTNRATESATTRKRPRRAGLHSPKPGDMSCYASYKPPQITIGRKSPGFADRAHAAGAEAALSLEG